MEIWWIYIQYKICKAETLSLHIKEDFPMIKGIVDFLKIKSDWGAKFKECRISHPKLVADHWRIGTTASYLSGLLI